eukprot:Filipodium_phascolosomae@DN3320_c0_g1_i1.p1
MGKQVGIKISAECGRYTVCTSLVKAGTAVIEEPPIVYAPSSSNCCHFCLRIPAQYCCPRCRVVRYCSTRCQKAAIDQFHSRECSLLCSDLSSFSLMFVRLFLYLRKLQTTMTQAPKLCCNLDNHSAEWKLQMIQMLILINSSLRYPQKLSFKEGLSLACQINDNAFTITDRSCNAVGLGIFAESSLINYSCIPSAVQTFVVGTAGKPPVLCLRAVDQLKTGEEITISYSDPFQPTDTTATFLQKEYGFTCTCRFCLSKPAQELWDCQMIGILKTPATVVDVDRIMDDLITSNDGGVYTKEELSGMESERLSQLKKFYRNDLKLSFLRDGKSCGKFKVCLGKHASVTGHGLVVASKVNNLIEALESFKEINEQNASKALAIVTQLAHMVPSSSMCLYFNLIRLTRDVTGDTWFLPQMITLWKWVVVGSEVAHNSRFPSIALDWEIMTKLLLKEDENQDSQQGERLQKAQAKASGLRGLLVSE